MNATNHRDYGRSNEYNVSYAGIISLTKDHNEADIGRREAFHSKSRGAAEITEGGVTKPKDVSAIELARADNKTEDKTSSMVEHDKHNPLSINQSTSFEFGLKPATAAWFVL